MTTTRTALTVLFALALSGPAVAAPITTGAWSPLTAPNNDGHPWFDNPSWDCNECAASWLVSQEFEYLHAPGDPARAEGFAFPLPSVWTEVDGISAYVNEHKLTQDPVTGEFVLDSGHGYFARSGVPGAWILMRLLRPDVTEYWAWVEDLPPGRTDADYNDRWLILAEAHEQPPVPEPAPIPEPALLLLVGIAAVVRATIVRRHA